MLPCHKNLKTNLRPLNAKAMSHPNPCCLPSVTHEISPQAVQITQCCILQYCQLPTVDIWWKCRNCDSERVCSDKDTSVTFLIFSYLPIFSYIWCVIYLISQNFLIYHISPYFLQFNSSFEFLSQQCSKVVKKGVGRMKGVPSSICHLLPLCSQGETKPYPTITYVPIQQHRLTYVPRVVQKEKRCVRLCLSLTHSPSFRPSYGQPNLDTFFTITQICLFVDV